MPTPADPADRRAWVRYPAGRELTVSHTATTKEHFRATLRDVSARAASLLLDRPFWPGTVLIVELAGCGRSVPARVSAARMHDAAPGGWVIVCDFGAPLTDDELSTLRT